MTGPGQIELVDRPGRAPARGEVRVKIEQCGICTSDLDLFSGRGQEPFPVAIGHEVAGTIAELGPDVHSLSVGDRVVAWLDDGGFAEEITVAERFCVTVDHRRPYPAVAEPLSCIVNAVELAAPALADDIVIVGAGYMGNLLQLVSRLKGPRSTTVIDIRPDALKRASRLGPITTVNGRNRSPAEVAAEVAPADVTYEVTGTQAGLELASELTSMGGKLCIVGYHLGGTRTVPLAHWNWMAFRILNAHFRDREQIMRGMRAGMRLVDAGLLDVAPLVTNTAPLQAITETFELALQKPEGFCKAMIEPQK